MEELAVLVTRTQSGDMEAYGEIVRRFQDMAYGYGYSILGDFTAAEDAAQESFIQAYKELGHLREPQAFPGWFRRIVYTQCAMMARRNRTKAVPLDEVAEMPSQVGDPHELAEKSEMRDRVLASIRALPENERVVTTLFYINGYSHDDIAGFLEVPLSTVKSRLHTARRRLKERMFDMVSDSLHSNKLPDDFDRRVIRKVILGLRKVDWCDVTRQNEFVSSVVSALNGMGEDLDYDYVCAVSGSAFRTSFQVEGWNHGDYHAINTPIIFEHTFRMLGYEVSQHEWGGYEAGSKLIMDSIDRGVPVITLGGVVQFADACVISGYDDGGRVLLGWSPFMHISDDHPEAADETGYFRKTDGQCRRILIIEGRCEKPDKQTVLAETLKLASRLIREESLVQGQHNGLAAHKAFADALLTRTWNDNGLVYLNVMCNYKQYLDRRYAVGFFRDHGRDDLAGRYEEIAALCAKLGQIIPQDFSAGDMFSDKEKLRPYCDVLLEIRDLEKRAADLLAGADAAPSAVRD